MTLALANVSIYHDVNSNGVVDPGEPAISAGGVPGNIGPIAAGASAKVRPGARYSGFQCFRRRLFATTDTDAGQEVRVWHP